jgi:hypothetical protein
MHEVHSAESEKADRPHAQILFADGPKRSLGDTDSCADFGEIERPVAIRLQKVFEPRDDRMCGSVMSAGLPVGRISEASDHDVSEFILQGAKHLRQFQNIGSVVCELSDGPM